MSLLKIYARSSVGLQSPPPGFITLIYDTETDQFTYKKPDGSLNYLGGGTPITDTNTKFLSGDGIPSDMMGDDEEHYLDKLTGKLYKKESGSWGEVFDFNTTKFLFGQGAPSNGDGQNGDYYQNVLNGIIYQKASGVWSLLYVPLQGGSLYWGSSAPSNTIGYNGDFYLNIATGGFFNKSGGNWDWIYNVGGKYKLYSTTGVPSNTLGDNDDHCFDVTTGKLYKKSTGAWALVYTPKDDKVHYYSGDIAPDSSLGENGDHYFMFANGYLFKKLGGIWTLVYQYGFNGTIPDTYITFPTDTLTSDDTGKLVMNKAGKAVVVNRDTPRVGQTGKWELQVIDYPHIPDPTILEFTFSGPPNQDDEIVLSGTQRFRFTMIPSRKFDISFGVDLEATLLNAKIKIEETNLYLVEATADKLRITFDNALTGGPAFSSIGFTGGILPPRPTKDGMNFYNSNVITQSEANEGNMSDILVDEKILDALITVLGLSVSMHDILSNATVGDFHYGYRWATSVNDFATNVANALSIIYAGVMTISVIDDVITIESDDIYTDNNPSAYRFLLSGSASTWFSVTTLQENYTEQSFNFVTNPIIGRLISVGGGLATINAPTVMKVKLSNDSAGVNVDDIGYEVVNVETVFRRFLLPHTDGTMITAPDVQTLFPGANTDIYYLLNVYNENSMTAISAGGPGDEILAIRGVPVGVIIALVSISNGTGSLAF